MKNRNLCKFVNSFLLLVLLATNQVAQGSSDGPQRTLASNLSLSVTSSQSSKALLSTVSPDAPLRKSPGKQSVQTQVPFPVLSSLISANLTSLSSLTADQKLNQTNPSKPKEHPANRFASDHQSISGDNKFHDHSSHLTNDSLVRLHKLTSSDLQTVTSLKHSAQTIRPVRLLDSLNVSLNSSLSATRSHDKFDVAQLSRTPSTGNQSQISREAEAKGVQHSAEQMSFIFSIDKLINLTNDHQPDKNDLYKKQTIITNHSNATSHANLPKNSQSSKPKKSNVSFVSSEPTTVANRTQPAGTPVTTVRPISTESNVSSVTVPNVLNEFSRLLPTAQKIAEKVQALAHPENQSLFTNRPQLAINSGSWEPRPAEKVLVYPVLQANQSNDQSLSAQSKRAPHYLEEKFRKQPDKLTTTTTTAPPERLDRPTPILDTRPLVEDVGSELNLRALDERLISEEELLHHSGSSVEDSSYEYAGHHGAHHSNLHHANKHNQSKQTLDPSWFEQNCAENCTCEWNGKWPEMNELGGQSRKTVNCSNNELDDYPALANELSKHVERLSLADNNIRTLQVNTEQFFCEKLIELDLSNNQLRQLSAGPFNYKHVQHPVVEFHPSHNHYLHREEEQPPTPSLKTTTSQPITAQNSTFPNSTEHLPVRAPLTQNATTPVTPKNITANLNRQNLFSHCHRLRLLVLSGNDLGTLSTGSFRGLKRLRQLYVDNAQVRFIEKNAFLGANELRLLSLRFNRLTAVHADQFQHMINLKVLDLTGNQLVYLGAGVFNSLVALQALHLGHNRLRQLSFQCFSGLDGLQLLTINANQLESVPRFALQPLKKLKILDMSNNPISKILEDDFSHSFVQLLLLNHLSQLQHVARFSFWDLPYLNELQITHCDEFVHLDEQAIVGAPSLHRLKLDHNAFSQLDDRLLENLARMTISARRQLKVFLSGNPFSCDCFLKPVYLVSASVLLSNLKRGSLMEMNIFLMPPGQN